jgi:co-chaperonin GroES (HSP10)
METMIEDGKKYMILKEGDILQKGDQGRQKQDKNWITLSCFGTIVKKWLDTSEYRRLITEPDFDQLTTHQISIEWSPDLKQARLNRDKIISANDTQYLLGITPPKPKFVYQVGDIVQFKGYVRQIKEISKISRLITLDDRTYPYCSVDSIAIDFVARPE